MKLPSLSGIRMLCFRMLTCCLIYPCIGTLHSQSPAVDSVRIEQYFERLGQHCYTDLDSTLFYLDTLLAYTDQAGWTEEHAYALLWGILCTGYQDEIEIKYDYLQRTEALLADETVKLPADIREEVHRDLQMHWGDYYLETGGYTQALDIYEPLAAKLEAAPELDDDAFERLVITYQYLASIHRQRGSYREAIDYYFRALNYEKQLYARQGEVVGDHSLAYSRIANAYRLLGERDRALHYYRSAFAGANSRYQANPEQSSRIRKRLVSMALEIGTYYRELGKPDSARFYLRAVEPLAATDDPLAQNLQLETAHILLQQEQYQHAHRLLNTILSELNAQPALSDRPLLARLFTLRANIYQAQQQYGPALQAQQQALTYLADDFTSDKLADNPDLANRLFSRELLHSLTQKARLLFEHPPGDRKDWLPAAWATAQLGMDLIDSIKIGFTSDYDKQYLLGESYTLYEIALAIITERAGPSAAAHAFRTMERSRSVALFAAVRDLHAREYAGVPDDRLEAVRRLQYQLAKVDAELSSGGSEEKQIALRDRRRQLQQQQQGMLRTFERDFPAYYRLKYDLQVPDLAWVQKQQLDRDTWLIEYFVGERYLYATVVNGQTGDSRVYQLPWSDELSQWAVSLKDDLYQGRDDAYRQKAVGLYQALLAPLLPAQSPTGLLIIPDGVLGYLPFDVLLTKSVPPTQQADYRNYPYLLRSTAISQCFSVGMLREMQRERRERNTGLLAVAPTFRSTELLAERSRQDVLGELLFNTAEAEAVSNNFDGRILLDQQATKQQFLRLAPNFRYYHIASHAVVNDASPHHSFIAFTAASGDSLQDFRLYSYEIFAHTFPADLIVLSACETGIGQIIRGEGIMSLARAFGYAGARSLVTSLWNINDASSLDVMSAFYRSLKEGLPKDKALQQAKLTYLETAADQARAHPRYWAAFVPIGDMQAIDSGIPWVWWAVIGGIVVLGATWWLRRKRTN